MKKVFFDASIHLGQFSFVSEETRIACKNSQVQISTKPGTEVIGCVTFNENSWADHTIWSIPQESQDFFYRFMDPFHSVKNIERVQLSLRDFELCKMFVSDYGLDVSNALTCAAAVGVGAGEIHTLYSNLLNPELVKFLSSKFSISLVRPEVSTERQFTEPELEERYQAALGEFRRTKLNLLQMLHG